MLLQVCCYLKQIHNNVSGFNGDWKTSDIPVVVVLGSKINCMTLATKWLLPYAQSHIVGYKSASTAYTKTENRQLLINIENESNIQAYSIVYDVMDKDCIKNICDSILKIGQGIDITDDLTENNISKAFDFFDMYVLDKKQANKLTSRQKVDLFIGTFYSEDFREDKSDRWAINNDIIRLHGIEIRVDPIKYNNFKLIFNMRQYSKLEQKRITAITDRLIDDTDRRRKGDFYTPSIWVDEAHKLLSKNLCSNWKEEYMVWDCAWGTGNLTRDYRFRDLYCSTLHNEDLNIGARYNKDACKFQYDFLNDDVEEFEEIEDMIKSALNMRKTNGDLANNTFESAMNKLKATKLYKCAPGLIDSLMGWNGKEKKKLLFFINPPYGTAKNGGADTISKKGIADTKVNNIMKKDNIGACSQQLYAQFIYRINKIIKLFNADIVLGLFAPPAYIAGPTYKKFRCKIILKPCETFLLQGSQFADVKDSWGICFSLLSKNGDFRSVNAKILDYSNGKVIELQNKLIYNLDEGQSLSDWIKIKDKGHDYPQMSNAINWKQEGRGKICDGALGYIMFNANNIEQSKQFVAITSSCMAGANGVSITENNFWQCLVGFTVRRLMSTDCNWINCKDEFMVPNIKHDKYEQFCADSLVYSIFNGNSNQSSLRNVEYKGNTYQLYNQFFWLSRDYIGKLAGGEFSTNDINRYIEDDLDCRETVDIQGNKFPVDWKKDVHGYSNNERYAYMIFYMMKYGYLGNMRLSDDTYKILSIASKLVKDSFKYRKEFNEKHPEYHINTWDAGWYQIKGMLKEYMPNELKEFNSLYKALEDRMRPLVYELGFLYK